MPTEFTLPNLGETVTSGTLAKVMVAVGDRIEENQPVIELETDKAVIEVPSTISGTIQEIFVNLGDKVEVGQKVFVMDTDGGAAESGTAGTTESAPTTSQATAGESAQPDGQGSSGGMDGEQAAPIEPRAQNKGMGSGMDTQEPQAASSENGAPAQEDGRPQTTAPTLAAVAKSSNVDANGSSGQTTSSAMIAAAPSVRRLARELGVDISQVKGSGPNGRISFSDVRDYLQRTMGGVPTLDGGMPVMPLPDFSKWGEVERQPMSNVRRATAEHMARSWATVPHVTQFDKADITELEKLRKSFGKKAEAAGGKLTVTAIALKVVAGALKVFPQFNASIDMATHEIVQKKYCHIGVAVDTDRGLLVPVIRDVDKKNILQLAAELTELGEKARNKKTSLEDMQGGSFTITNLGGIGGTGFTPIVNAPEVAILGVARGSIEPVFIDDGFEPRLMLPLSLSYDHRVIDGADGARFLRWIASALEQPFLLSLEG